MDKYRSVRRNARYSGVRSFDKWRFAVSKYVGEAVKTQPKGEENSCTPCGGTDNNAEPIGKDTGISVCLSIFIKAASFPLLFIQINM